MLRLSTDEKDIAAANVGSRGEIVSLNPCTIELEAGINVTLCGDPGSGLFVGQKVCFVEPYLN